MVTLAGGRCALLMGDVVVGGWGGSLWVGGMFFVGGVCRLWYQVIMVGAKPLVVGGEDPSVGDIVVCGQWVILKVTVDMAHTDILCMPHQMFVRGHCHSLTWPSASLWLSASWALSL